MAGLPCLYGNALAEKLRDEIDYSGLGRLLAVTPNAEVNALVCIRYLEDFGRKEVYQLAFPAGRKGRHEVLPEGQHGRLPFSKGADFSLLSDVFGSGSRIKTTPLTKEFDFEAFKAEHGDVAIPLFVLKPQGALQVCTAEEPPHPSPGDSIVSIVPGPQHTPPTVGAHAAW
jgi:hypothetical protein